MNINPRALLHLPRPRSPLPRRARRIRKTRRARSRHAPGLGAGPRREPRLQLSPAESRPPPGGPRRPHEDPRGREARGRPHCRGRPHPQAHMSGSSTNTRQYLGLLT